MRLFAALAACSILALAGGVTAANAQGWRDRGDDRRGGPDRVEDRRGGGGERWEELGCFAVGPIPERGIIPVGRGDGRFLALRFTAAGKDISIEDIRVVYGNGQPDNLQFRAIVREGVVSNPIDLRGADRAIQRIELIARKVITGFSLSRARLCVSALEDPRRPQPETARWEKLGCADFGRRLENLRIPVGRREGRYRAVRLEVGSDAMHIENLNINYFNGPPEQQNLQAEVRPGTITNPVDLRGRERAIDSVDVIARKLSRRWTPGLATLCVAGLQDLPPPPPPVRWEPLGCVELGRRPEIGVISVGRREGRFKAIKLDVSGKDARIDDMKIVYANGRPDDIRVAADIPSGGQSNPLDLQGRERAIDRIEISGRKGGFGPGKSKVCISGLDDDRGRGGPPPRPRY